MAFNLLNSVLSSANTTSAFQQQFPNKLSQQVLDQLEVAKVITADQASAARTAGALPVGLPAAAAKAAANAGISPIPPSDGSPGGGEGSEIIVTGRKSAETVDNRLRISALSGQANRVYGENDKSGNILAPLHSTGGLMFPYTPSIQIAGDTDWTPHALTHTNYDIYSYQRTPSATINLSGKFTVQNQREGEYALACIHFLRTMGKMYYGEQDSADYNPSERSQSQSNAGLPPPVLRLRGYGTYMFNDLRCVLKNYSFSFEETMDLVTINSQTGGDVLLPPMFTISVSLLLQQNPTRLRRDFKLDDFRTGSLMRQSSSGGWF